MLVNIVEASHRWEKSRWPNFSVGEMSCPCCGEVWWAPSEFDRIQLLRTNLQRPVALNSTHRCRRHNALVGGAPLSEHKKIAFDFSLSRGRNIRKDMEALSVLQSHMLRVGFGSFGLYGTFIHCDSRVGRFWVTPAGKNWSQYFRRVSSLSIGERPSEAASKQETKK
ncbi:D-Ala-D-Ala carboxypeptidase family metallohydrolase [Candidatus Persebacteraceae bacterium Df01]|jgi:hypothetical protein|uniref:D-Ala-D-Ala carboxypeptidase family metallohydrolase n=1 Tax=Candidatus Doriopsillibacter californiensis TaxID=2970740 RepID=A0ABT7QLT1_9GAMM|nr:D-Ala-D-Ala carboxypeptidase family metallohydrolase [Candidatus Persebacteraceae bacterium Df01]